MTPFVRPLPCSIAEALGEEPAPTPQRADPPWHAWRLFCGLLAFVLFVVLI